MLILALLACIPTAQVERQTDGTVAYDADDDGFADVAIVRMPDPSSGGGALVVFFGGEDGLVQSRSEELPIDVPFGQASWVGDLNGDGFADAAVTSDTFGRPPTVSLAYGGPRGSLQTGQVQCNGGPPPEDEAGAKVGRAGDVNGDGVDDLVVSAAMRTCVWFGGPAGIDGEPDQFESRTGNALQRVFGVGDVDGDGYDDVALSEIRAGGPDGLSDRTLPMPVFPAAGPTDVNGDGEMDLIGDGPSYSAYFGTSTGFEDTALTHSFNSDLPLTIESEMVHLGDIDGDGLHDSVLSIPFRDQAGLDTSTEGGFHVLYGGADALRMGAEEGETQDLVHTAATTEAIGVNGFRTGYVIGLGDIDGDGFGDIGVENALGGLAWIRGSARGIPSGEAQGHVLVNRSNPRMAATGAGVF